MDLMSDVMKYMMDKAGPLAVVLMMVIWWGYKLLLKKEEVIEGMANSIVALKGQIADNRETQARFITLLETLIYGKRNV